MPDKDITISEFSSVRETLKKLDYTAEKVLLVVNHNKRFMGTITDGDIRRYILNGGNIQGNIAGIYNRKALSMKKKAYSSKLARRILLQEKIELLPILDDNEIVVDFVTWKMIFSENKEINHVNTELNLPVVIMAGGKGSRLDPFTRILPKPLIPLGERTIVEVIIDEFRKCGVRDYYLILNYKGEMIESYLSSKAKNYNVTYLWEKDFYGTAGGLGLLTDSIADNFIVTNCDVIVNADFFDISRLHIESQADLTILSSIQNYKIPYGVIEFRDGGEVVNILEKPEHMLVINTGVYILHKRVLPFIPKNTHFDMTDLISKLISERKKVITYPVSESKYRDIGQWEEYLKVVRLLENF